MNIKTSALALTMILSMSSFTLQAAPQATAARDTVSYFINPSIVRQNIEGWGVSLCWWARMCGEWDDNKIDQLVTWMVSPTGLNYRIFRYNIGGGDDPQNRNCTPHHMGDGKGLRAEMEGFKDFSGDSYHWDRDAGQRKIMLKIKEKRPDAIFEAFSNSCPYYMTYSGCVSGNDNAGSDNLRPEYYDEFAHYLVDVCKHYKDEYGIEFRTLEPFNESMSNYWGRNGGQEGCHFDAASQVNFIKVLSPILKESGLSTVISASDETSVGQSVAAFQEYQNKNILSLVGQWNTHTYGASNKDRARISCLSYQNKIPLWMSEVGSGGSGLAGNLALAQKLIDDVRYIQPIAWIDWQYVEEWNDQWCTVKGSFSGQTFERVKNYYVRQHCSRFIRTGYDIVESLNANSLAAVNQARDSLVIVIVNEGSEITHNIDLSCFYDFPQKSKISVYRTTDVNSCSKISSFKLLGSRFVITLPEKSIITAVLPVKSPQPGIDFSDPDQQYLIIPRYENNRAVSASSAGGNVTVEDINLNDENQIWTITAKSGKYVFENGSGLKITAHRSSNSTSLTAETGTSSEQSFYIDAIDPVHYKISSSNQRTYSFDLVGESASAGNRVGLWEYNASSAPVHRQWMILPLPKKNNPADAIENVWQENDSFETTGNEIISVFDMSGRCVYEGNQFSPSSQSFTPGIYILKRGRLVKKIEIKP